MRSDTLGADVLDDAGELAACTRWTDGPAGAGARVAVSSLQLSGLHCAACAGIIEAALKAVPGVLDARVNAAARVASVRWHSGLTLPAQLAQAVRGAGYDAVPDTAAEARALRASERRQAAWRLFVAWLCAMQIMMLATPAYLADAGDLTADLKRLLDWGSWMLSLPVLLFSAAPFFAGAWRALRRREIAMDVPVALGIAVAFVASTGATFDPGGALGSEVWFDSLTMFIAFLLSGRWLEMAARHSAAEELERTVSRLPDHVQRVRADGGVETVAVQRLVRGDVVRVPLGQAFAADGALTRGSTRADESLLSGESAAIAKTVGDTVIAGSINLGAPVEMRVEHLGADTRYEGIVALMREAQGHRPALAATADRWAGPFLWGVLLLAAGAAAAWSFIEPSRALAVAVAVLVVTCPCALSLAAPSALLAAARAAARGGVLLRRLDALEALDRVQTVFVDKTGTLTDGTLVCSGLQRTAAAAGFSDDALRSAAGSLAAWSQHPLSRALAAVGGPPASGASWNAIIEHPGRGLEAADAAGRRWRLGSADWAGSEAIADAGPQVWLSRDGTPLARFDFTEALRADTASAIAALQAGGVSIAMLSGDRPERVARVAAALGIDAAVGGLSAEDKLAMLRAAQHRGRRVAMVGDGVNDAPVLAQADVSFAIGDGASLARLHADAVLLSGSLAGVAALRALARRTMRVIRQNLGWAAAYNAVCVPLALAGFLPPWAAGIGMAASSLFVVLNSLRLARPAD